ncbi:calpain-1 catalytic subunit-like [Eucyclogobius newberryi]|uniref:calpain-1 catalytic subunit-like n=1 Tax=Eucyclogobius newberryi TaxID=166745 RepID=UPI003B5B255E
MPPPGVCLNIIEACQKQNGYGSVLLPIQFNNQDYKLLKQYCLGHSLKFVDKTFPPDLRTIGPGILDPADLKQVKWLRPLELSPNPSLVVAGISRFDFSQGILGNCWFLASIGALTFQNQIFRQVVPLEQNFDNEYSGIFHFRFWRFGRWVDVVIDDKLPTLNGRLIFVCSKNSNEFWPALLEKAYAKVCGSYGDMKLGVPAEALVDFTGGVHLTIQLSQPPADLWELMCRAGTCTSLMSCGTTKGDNKVLPNGLVQGHAYTVTGVKEVLSSGKTVQLVRVWNPWGRVEWNGDWSDLSPLWQSVSSQDRDLCLSVSDNGEFWMSLQDFCQSYNDLDICSPSPEFLDGTASCHWNCQMYEGRWVAGTTAGGCRNNKDTFWTNLQYHIKVQNDKHLTGDEKNILVSLMQKPDKRNRRLVHNFHIGFSVFEYKSTRGKLPASFFSSSAPIFQTMEFMNAREVVEFFTLSPGEYIIVPSTFRPNETASFLLTICSKAQIQQNNCEDSSDFQHDKIVKVKDVPNALEVENWKQIFHQYCDKYEEVDAEQLQKLLNEKLLEGIKKSGDFTLDACRSLVALMDTSITGRLNSGEFLRLWKKTARYKEIFYQMDVSQTGTLSLHELRNAMTISGMKVSDSMLNLMALRYGASAGHMSLESFISLSIRLECMSKIYHKLSHAAVMALNESDWMHLYMYT